MYWGSWTTTFCNSTPCYLFCILGHLKKKKKKSYVTVCIAPYKLDVINTKKSEPLVCLFYFIFFFFSKSFTCMWLSRNLLSVSDSEFNISIVNKITYSRLLRGNTDTFQISSEQQVSCIWNVGHFRGSLHSGMSLPLLQKSFWDDMVLTAVDLI